MDDRSTKRSRRGFMRQLATLAAGGTAALLVPAVANAATPTAGADVGGAGAATTAGAGAKTGSAAVAGGSASAVERAAVAAGCAVYCRPVVCDWTNDCPGWSITLRCTNYCDGSSFILCKSFAEPCAGFCYSRNLC